jgi:hypothetical protein
MKFSLEKAQELKACQSGIDWYKANGEPDTVEKTVEACIKTNELNYANWLLSNTLAEKQCGIYAVFAAEQVIDIFEVKYPDDKRPRLAIEAAKKVIENDTPENRNAAADAAHEAYAAANASYAAYAAAYAAADGAYAAYAAARAAANASYAAAYSAADAASHAADAAMKIKIIKYGVTLLGKE